MKIQYIAVLFIVIIIPIVVTSTMFINAQMKTIKLQNDYNSRLTDATYDAVQAFKINTVNNQYSSISDSKIRDIEASINTFYNNLTSSGKFSREDLDTYVPALVYTLYDGYYIYSKYDNVIPSKEGIDSLHIELNTNENELDASDEVVNTGLKPYIYYSCRYKKEHVDFVVNFTLDNAITVYGNLPNIGKSGYSYQTLSGYLINPNYVTDIDEGNFSLKYNGVEIKKEILTEHLLFSTDSDNDGNYDSGDFDYIIYDGQKTYYDPSNSDTPYFRYQNYSKSYIPNSSTNLETLIPYLNARTSGRTFI